MGWDGTVLTVTRQTPPALTHLHLWSLGANATRLARSPSFRSLFVPGSASTSRARCSTNDVELVGPGAVSVDLTRKEMGGGI